ncbi:MAG: hypothetical protein ACR2O6_12635 [Ilumatobacteraceae bacterium]
MGAVQPRRTARWSRRWPVLVAPLVLMACNDGGSAADTAPATASTVEDGEALVPDTESGTRPVPTVPPSTIEGQTDSEPGVIEASPTIAPPPVDPNEPTSSVLPPTTELVGDPQPEPGVTVPPPPPPTTEPGDPDACGRLAAFDVIGIIVSADGPTTTAESVAEDVCRYSSGAFVAEVHFMSVSDVRDDWFTRSGIEPVGEVSGDAVGFSSFIPPGASGGDGYTIAVEGGTRGVVVAVGGTADARLVAAQVAIFAGQAA